MKELPVASARFWLLSLILVFALALSLPLADQHVAEASSSSAVVAVNGLAEKLYSQFASGGGNLCFSPYSISTAFAMTYAGARGETGREMERGLGFAKGIHSANRELAKRIQSYPESAGRVDVANSIWPAINYRLLPAFERIIKQDYRAELLPQDYPKDSEGARARINDWVEEKTQQKIKDILARGTVRPDTRMVLVNAIYFKAAWMEPFVEGLTKESPFHVTSKETVTVPMMNRTGSVSYAEFAEAQVLKLPYQEGAFSMVIILPGEGMLALCEKRLTAARLKTYNAALAPRRVDVYLPKFKIESSFDLGSAIPALGVVSAFNPGRADFSGMNGRRDLFISAAVHKAFIEVDEGGTEAAAATAIAMRLASIMPDDSNRPVFRADRPFIYVIQEEETGAILFIGKTVRPN